MNRKGMFFSSLFLLICWLITGILTFCFFMNKFIITNYLSKQEENIPAKIINITNGKGKYIDFIIEETNKIYKGGVDIRRYNVHINDEIHIIFDKSMENYIILEFIKEYNFDNIFGIILGSIVIISFFPGIILLLRAHM